jgi:hypothetical protein
MMIDLSAFDLTDPLLEASGEVFALEDYLGMMEAQISHLQKSQRLKIDAYIRKERLTSNDPEWHECHRECNNVPEMGMKSVPPW